MTRHPWIRRAALVAAATLAAPLVVAGSTASSASPTKAVGSSDVAEATASSGVAETAGSAQVPLSELAISSTAVATGLERLSAITAPDDGSGRILVTEKVGKVRVFRPDSGVDPVPLLDMRDRVNVNGNERGLLGVATSPDFASTHTLFVAYTSLPDGALTLSRFRLEDADRASVPVEAEEVVLTQQHSRFSNHNGGQIAFGPDGYLYWSLGDGGAAADPFTAGQNLSTLLGKVLRLDVMQECAGQLYCIPNSNPFARSPIARPEIWAYGLRNPWRFSFDAEDGSLWLADVGQNRFEEVNHLPRGGRGANLGWSCREGPALFNESRCLPHARYVDPVFWYRTDVDGCAVMGGFVYRGREFADLAEGTYVAADYCNGATWGVRPTRGRAYEAERIGDLPARTTTFGVDQSGELYLATDTGELHTVSFSRAS